MADPIMWGPGWGLWRNGDEKAKREDSDKLQSKCPGRQKTCIREEREGGAP